MDNISMNSINSNKQEADLNVDNYNNNNDINSHTDEDNHSNNNINVNNMNNNENMGALNNKHNQDNGINISKEEDEEEEEEKGRRNDNDKKTNKYKNKKSYGYNQEEIGSTSETGKYNNPGFTDSSMDILSDPEKSETSQRAMMSDNRVIDFVLSYKKNSKREDDEEEEILKMRKSFEENLQDFGIEIEREEVTNDCFVKLHCPWDTLCRGAQLIKLKKPVSTKNIQPQTTDKWIGCIKRNEVKVQVHQPFTIKEINSFVIEDKKTFFSSAERNYITHSILERTVFQSEDRIQTGLENLLGDEVYNAAFPLHDPLSTPRTAHKNNMNQRELLLSTWSNKRNIFRPQPLLLIRSYFGEMFAFYFAWMGMYTGFLAIAAVFGLAVTSYGVISLYTSPITINEVCDDTKAPGNFLLCPKCDRLCNYTQLSELCTYAKLTQVFDNGGTLFFAVFICIWAICFCEMWKRRQYFLQYLWSVNDFENNENVRPEYEKQATLKKTNPISGLDETFVPSYSLILRRCLSFSMVFFLLSVVIITIIAVLMYRFLMTYTLHQSSHKLLKGNAQIITTVTAATLNLIFITILSQIYKWLAKVLTDIEAHKTRSSYQDAFIFKIVIFQFINNYGAIIYIAFFKGSFVDSPGHNSMYVLGKYKQDECESIGCMSELTIQLIIIMMGKQFFNAILEMIIPFIMRRIKMRDNKVSIKYLPWERDLDLAQLQVVPISSEYLEMVIQYGFVVLFVAAFPLAPLFAFINNLIEIRLDAYKMLRFVRRPPGLKAQDIGAWQHTIESFSQIAVITNAFIIAWTSDFIPKLVYSHLNGGQMAGYLKYTFVSFVTSNFTATQGPDPDNFPASVNVTECRYRAYSSPSDQVSSDYETFYWHVLCARWVFVIIFEHACFLFISLLRSIPDQSDNVKLIREYEKTIRNQVEVNDLFERVRNKKSSMNIVSPFLKPTNFSNSVQDGNNLF